MGESDSVEAQLVKILKRMETMNTELKAEISEIKGKLDLVCSSFVPLQNTTKIQPVVRETVMTSKPPDASLFNLSMNRKHPFLDPPLPKDDAPLWTPFGSRVIASIESISMDRVDPLSTKDNPVRLGTLFGSDTELMKSCAKIRQCWVIDVEGYDTSLPVDDIKKALTDHFRSCGLIPHVEMPRYPVDTHASVIIVGDDANDRALALNGSELGGRKLVVTAEKFPQLQMKDVPFG